MRRGWRLVFDLLPALFVFALAATEALVKAKLIGPHPGLTLTLAIVAGMVIFVESAWSGISRFRGKGFESRRAEIEKALKALLMYVSRETHADISLLGASAFVVKRRWPFFWRRHLYRVVRLRWSDHPQVSNVAWNSGTGAIGLAWKAAGIVHVDWTDIQTKWGDGKLQTDADWELVSAKDRYGFTRSEFENVVDKYAEILAIPFLVDPGSKCLGVCSIDIPMREPLEGKGNLLASESIIEYGTFTASTISDVVSRD